MSLFSTILYGMEYLAVYLILQRHPYSFVRKIITQLIISPNWSDGHSEICVCVCVLAEFLGCESYLNATGHVKGMTPHLT